MLLYSEFYRNFQPSYEVARSSGAKDEFRPQVPCTRGAAAYQLGNTSSRTITEVKQR